MQLIHGDCISAMEQMPDGSVDLILTDPPYNIKVKRTKNGKARTEEWDCIKDYPDFMMRWIAQAHRVLKPQGVMYFFHNDMNQLPEIMERIRQETDFALISFLIWDKVNYRTNRWKNGKPECAPPNSTGRLHVCQKPVQLLRRLVRVSSNPGDVVLDCFMGSGSTGCAALREGRDFIGIELDAGFFAAAKKRIEEEAANPYADNLTIWDDTLTRRACRTGANRQPQTSKLQ